MIPKRNIEVLKEFRKRQQVGQAEKVDKPTRKPTHIPPKSLRTGYDVSPYSTFLKKYNDLEDSVDTFKTRDFVYFFREVAEENGYKYVISNIKKDMAIFKRLAESYAPREICCMIEFLFNSEQDYLDKTRLSPNLLASQWVNTIYADMKLWVNDEYTPKSKKKHKSREWTAPVSETSSTSVIGEWE